MKKIKIFISILLVFSIFAFNNLYALSSNLSVSNSNIKVGTTVTVSFSVNGAASWQYEISYDSSKLQHISGNLKDANTSDDGNKTTKTVATITFKAISAGAANVSVTGLIVDEAFSNSSVSSSRTINITNVTTPAPTPTPKPAPKPQPTPGGGTSGSSGTTPTLSNNAYLSQFRVDQPGMSPSFNKAKYSYAITVGKNVTNLGVTAIAEHNKATVSITGNRNLKEGNNVITVRVTAQDKKTVRTYTINATKTDDPIKSNALLENLIITNAKLEPEFSKEVFEYDAGNVSANTKKLDISAFAENEKAKIDIIGNDSLIDGENTIKIIVTSENSKIQRTYSIKVVKEKDEKKLDEDGMLVINPYEEVGIGTTKGKDISAFSIWLSDMWDILKSNAVILLLYAFIWIEVLQVVYLYEKLKKQEQRYNTPLEPENKNKQPTRRGNINEIEDKKDNKEEE